MAHTKYDEIHIVNDTTIFRENYKWGLLNKDKRILLPPLYDYIESKGNEILVNYDGERFIINLDKLPIPYTCLYYLEDYNLIKTFKDGKYGIIDKTFKEIVPCSYDDVEFRANKIWAGTKINEKESLTTIYSYDGTVMSKNQYILPFPSFIQEESIVSKFVDGRIKYGIVDDNSNEVVECLYDNIDYFSHCNRSQYPSLNNVLILSREEKKFIYHKNKGLEPNSYQDVFWDTHYDKLRDSDSLFSLSYKGYYFGLRDSYDLSQNNTEIKPTTIIDVFHTEKLIFSFHPYNLFFPKEIIGNLFICQSKESMLFSMMTPHGLAAPFIYNNIYYRYIRNNAKIEKHTLDFVVAERVSQTTDMTSIEVDFYSLEGKLLLQSIPKCNINWELSIRTDNTIYLKAGDTYIFNTKTGFINKLPNGAIFNINEAQNGCFFVKGSYQGCLMNLEGRIVIPFNFKTVLYAYVSEHLLKKHLQDVTYYIINNGTVRKMQYEYMEEVSYLFFKVAKDFDPELPSGDEVGGGPCFGLINFKGNEIIPCKHFRDDITILSPNCIKIIDGRTIKYVNEKGLPIIENIKYYNGDYQVKKLENENILVYDTKTRMYFLADKNKKKLTIESYNYISNFNKNGVAKISKGTNNDGLISIEGKIILSCNYDLPQNWENDSNNFIDDFYRGGSKYMKIYANGHIGYIDLYGNLIIPPIYTKIDIFSDENFAFIEKNHKKGIFSLEVPYTPVIDCFGDNWSFTNINNNFLVIVVSATRSIIYHPKTQNILLDLPFELISISFQHNEIWGLLRKNYGFVLWDSLSNTEVDTYDRIGYKKHQYIQVKKEQAWGLYDLNKKREIITCKYFLGYEKLSDYYLFPYQGTSVVCFDKKFYLVNSKDGIVSAKYDNIEDFVYGCAIIKTNQEYSFIDCKGKTVSFGYEQIRRVSYADQAFNLLFYRQNDHWGLVDTKGNKLAYGFEEIGNFHEGYASIKRNGKWGFINQQGIIVIPCRFAKVGFFSEGLAPVAFKTLWGYIDKNNNTIIPFQYTKAYSFEKGIADVYLSKRNNEAKCKISKSGHRLETEATQYNTVFEDEDANRETWYAMTDGVYGDYPDDFDGDYYFMGY